MAKKRTYRIRNWAEYNKSLIQRGDITVWFSNEARERWMAKATGNRGWPQIYSDDAILCALMVKVVYHLPLRALVGFLKSLLCLLGVCLPVPSYTQISRRAARLGQEVHRLSKRKRITDIVIDSSGLKVFGEGEWKVRQHGKSKRRTWRKIHLAVCAHSQEVVLSLLTTNSESDEETFVDMGDQLPTTVERGYGDGAYDKTRCYQKFHERGIIPIVPPQRGAVLHNTTEEPWMSGRNNAIREIAGLGNDDEARAIWKRLMGYHLRSLAETAMYRYKTLFGDNLMARRLDRQKGEVLAKSLAMNRMTQLGMPIGEWVA
jgi:Transposase DDE domain